MDPERSYTILCNGKLHTLYLYKSFRVLTLETEGVKLFYTFVFVIKGFDNLKRTIKIITAVATKRFAEILVINVILSVIVMALNTLHITKTQYQIFMSASAAVLISMILNFLLLRDCYYELVNKLRYYVANYIAYIAFFVVNLAVGFFFDNYVYAWLFSITKFARFSHYGWSSLVSACVFFVVMIVPIHLAPIGMGHLFEDDGI